MSSKCWLQISSGNGPEECCCAVGKVYGEIKAEAMKKGISVSLIHAVPSQVNGNFKSILLSLVGDSLGNFCRGWQGTVQWIWKSQYRPHHKRKNWFVGVEVLNPPENQEQWTMDELRIETCRSTGPGGQHVNKTESAVRIIHLTTGITVHASEERSQHMNKKLALARLDAILRQRHQKRQMDHCKERWHKHYQLVRGSSIRIYKGSNFTPIKTQGDADDRS